VPGRNGGHVARTHVGFHAVLHFHVVAARIYLLKVRSFAPFGLYERLDVIRPLASLLEMEPCDGAPGNIDQFDLGTVKFPYFKGVRLTQEFVARLESPQAAGSTEFSHWLRATRFGAVRSPTVPSARTCQMPPESGAGIADSSRAHTDFIKSVNSGRMTIRPAAAI
jgi:hypothetical protein